QKFGVPRQAQNKCYVPSLRRDPQREENMRRGEPFASLEAKAWVRFAKLASTLANLFALDRYVRTFRVLAAIAAGLVSFAHEAPAQEPVHRIAMLTGVPYPEVEQAFRDELRARGYNMGRNLQIEVRYTQGQFDRLPTLVCELVALRPEIIVVTAPQYAGSSRRRADNSNGVRWYSRPGGDRPCAESGASRWQRHRNYDGCPRRLRGQTAGVAKDGCARCITDCDIGQSDKPDPSAGSVKVARTFATVGCGIDHGRGA